MFKTRIEGNNMFCDFYNPSTLTYCKRLRVMCPEHTKAPVVKDNEVRLDSFSVKASISEGSKSFM